ncbi:phospholipase D family protein [Aliiruegeria lutimaris]|uniref:phospholipase D family protein n=1 Tax=Aliiruegeria lutimaris TaxID=571298 RepID=UPI00147B66E9|nr:phospholipase D family protein [Aliiruegeria lutimaris]
MAATLARNLGKSAILPLVDGNDALGARLAMIETAEHSVDLQYFLIKPDHAGALVAATLLDAADRGVRVRFLLDDALTTADDSQIARLDVHPNIEIRLLNPLSRKSPTFWNYLVDFDRVNRRMHNKSMSADGTISILGGRNIADEYYRIGSASEFADFDVLLAGPVVADIGRQFDLYWNDPLAVPLRALMAQRGRTPEQSASKSDLEARYAEALNGYYRRAVDSVYLNDVRQGRIRPHIARIGLTTDDPEKLKVPVSQGDRRVAMELLDCMNRATSEVILLTPYFVPQDWGEKFFSDLARRGVRVRILTNSLASNNHPYVHGGYMHRRRDLLQAGVELYEIRADAPEVTGQIPEGSGLTMTMHTKLAVIDGRDIFVGSLNFDPRSIKINTELGVFLSDPAAGGNLKEALEGILPEIAWKLGLDGKGDITWTYSHGGRSEQRIADPDASGWAKIQAAIARMLPVEGLL